LFVSFQQATVCATFVAYVSGAVYGITKITPSVDYEFLVPYGDVQLDYMHAIDQHFLEYPPPVQVEKRRTPIMVIIPFINSTTHPCRQLMIGGSVDYSNHTIQAEIESMLQMLESSEHFREDLYTQSWLRNFLYFVQRSNELRSSKESQMDVSKEAAFIHVLQHVYNTNRSTLYPYMGRI
jgi:hypothetical protein